MPWPQRGTGGLAEMQPSESPRLMQLELRLYALSQGRAVDYAPGMLLQAREFLVRAKREFAGGLVGDAEYTSDQLEFILVQLEARWPHSPVIPRRS